MADDGTASAGGLTQSGTRLRAQFFHGADGSKAFTGMFDTQLSTTCTMGQTALDGVLRCLPTPTSSAYFADANCAVPVVFVNTADGGSVVSKPDSNSKLTTFMRAPQAQQFGVEFLVLVPPSTSTIPRLTNG